MNKNKVKKIIIDLFDESKIPDHCISDTSGMTVEELSELVIKICKLYHKK